MIWSIQMRVKRFITQLYDAFLGAAVFLKDMQVNCRLILSSWSGTGHIDTL